MENKPTNGPSKKTTQSTAIKNQDSLEPVLENTEQNKASNSLENVRRLQVEAYSGPIPDAKSMAAYGEVDPTFPHRILAMAENQTAHRIAVENKAINLNAALSFLGIILNNLTIIIVCLTFPILAFYFDTQVVTKSFAMLASFASFFTFLKHFRKPPDSH